MSVDTKNHEIIDHKLYTRQEFAEFLGISIVTFDRYRRKGYIIPPFYLGNKPFWTGAMIKSYLRSLEERKHLRTEQSF